MKCTTVDQFLGTLSDRLRGVVSEQKRHLLISEQALWLDQLVNYEIANGQTATDAEHSVVSQNGCPKQLAANLAYESYEDEVNSPVYNMLGRANVTANAVLGLMAGLYMAFLHIKSYLPSPAPVTVMMIPTEWRAMFPEPLPIPDMSWQFYVSMIYPLLAPFIGGWICGRLIPIYAARAVYRIVVLMALGCFLMGLMLLPDRTAIMFAALLTLFWLPVGAMTAHISSSILRRQRRRCLEGIGWNPTPPLNLKEKGSL